MNEGKSALERWYDAIPYGEKKKELMKLAKATGRSYTACLWWVRGMSSPSDDATWEAVERVTGVRAPKKRGDGDGRQ